MSILVDDSNKTACRAAEAGLQQKNCAALVRPAGTGKGCIVWELLDAHPEMRVLWVVSCAARLELRRALTKRLGRTLGGRVRLMSCEQLAVQNALGWVALAEFRPGLLVLDGWREMSAKDWADCVQPLFRFCPGAKLLALGEPDAPGDSCRAAEEMLADAIVEPLALGGAMAEGLLPMPASYTALLWPLEDAMARLRAEVKNLHLPGCPDPNAEKYQALSLAVEKLPPVEQLLAQWLPDAAGRCLVLCEDDAAAAQTAEQAEKLFGAGTHIYKDAEGFAADEAATLRLLVCANGPAVQAPLAGISGVVLVRRSAGPAAYRQMLARALAACGSVPVAELSAAFEALTCVQQLRKECSAAGAEAFPLEEPLSACRRAYRQLRRALDSDWERYYAAAKQMTAEGKTLDVPRSYSFGGVAVGRWLENQRLVRAGKKKGRLTAAQAARLDKIGMNWQKRLELAWENGCASARRYRDSHSDLLVPVHYKDKDGFALGEWIVYNRQRYLGGNLPSDRVERLEALGMVWDTGSILWEKSYAAAVQYYLENHTLEIPVKYVTPDGMALGVWLGSQRAAYKEGVLTDAQIEKLEALGVDWTNRNDRKWQTAYEAAVKYHAAHGNLDVPIEYIDEDGILLGKWVSRQRYAWQNPERSSARVTPERKALLDELGMNWEKTDSWQHRYELAVEYKKEHGSLAVPAQYRTEDGIWLGSWLSRQKQMLREGKKLSAKRRAALKELFKGEKGRRLSAPVPPACSVREQNWLDNYQSARLYAEKKGSLLVPAGYVDENGFRLGVWISNLRAARKARPGSFQVTPEHIALLDAIGMQWDAREAKWAGAFRRAEEYCAALRELFQGENTRRLTATVPPACSVREQNWLDNYQSAKRYAEKKGTLLVPAGYVDESGFRLGVWISNLRAARKARPESFQVTPEHIAMLDAIGMQWDAREAKWDGAFRRAEEYRAAHGDLLVPVNYKTGDGFCLGDWVRRMRESYAAADDRLTAAHVQKLEALGMVWTMPQES